VHLTIASAFNDPGTNRFYEAVMRAVVAETGDRGFEPGLSLPTGDDASLHVVPPERSRYLAEIVGRPQCQNIRYVQTTITEDNEASWAMFESFAKIVGAPTQREELFDREKHFNGQHASEILLTIGPFQPWQVIARTRHERVS